MGLIETMPMLAQRCLRSTGQACSSWQGLMRMLALLHPRRFYTGKHCMMNYSCLLRLGSRPLRHYGRQRSPLLRSLVSRIEGSLRPDGGLTCFSSRETQPWILLQHVPFVVFGSQGCAFDEGIPSRKIFTERLPELDVPLPCSG